jgi:hypothetical protein
MPRSALTLTTVTAIAIAAGLALAGCSLGGAPTAASSSAASSSSPSASASHDAGDDNGDDSTVADATMPKNFPDDVPIIDGKLVYSADLGEGWILYFRSDDFGDGYQDASGKLTDAGFDKSQEVTDPQGDVAAFSNDKYQIILTAGTDSTYGKSVAYTVTKK